MRRHLIVGCGPAALSAVEAIRKMGGENDITVITAENCPPYSPAALPYLLAGRISEERFWLRDQDYLDSLGVTVRKGKRVVEVDPGSNQAVCADGSRMEYDDLLLATGARPLGAGLPGLGEDEAFHFHTLADYRRLTEELATTSEVAVYGAGLVATELALSLLERGIEVTMVTRSRLLRRYFGPEAGDVIQRQLESEGIKIISGVTVTAAHRQGARTEIALSNGQSLLTGLLVVALGVVPNTPSVQGEMRLAAQGIWVDGFMRTSIANVYAAGDVAAAPSLFGDVAPNAILPNALDQGRVAGINMAGGEELYPGWIPVNLLSYFGRQAFSIGLVNPANADASSYKILQDGVPGKVWRKLVFHGNLLVGAEFVNVPVDPGIFRSLIRERVEVADHQEALFNHPRDTSRSLMLKREQGSKPV